MGAAHSGEPRATARLCQPRRRVPIRAGRQGLACAARMRNVKIIG